MEVDGGQIKLFSDHFNVSLSRYPMVTQSRRLRGSAEDVNLSHKLTIN